MGHKVTIYDIIYESNEPNELHLYTFLVGSWRGWGLIGLTLDGKLPKRFPSVLLIVKPDKEKKKGTLCCKCNRINIIPLLLCDMEQ